ncbi:MAG TPA: Yip1 family protein [Elainellaceae cyanobacterium]
MTDTTLSRFWELVGWVFALNEEAFRIVSTVPNGMVVALTIVLLAGLSQAIAQGVILFINRVKPSRFVFSLLISAILFALGFICLVFSTWLITLFSGSISVSFKALTVVLGISYAPLLFSFLGALPYLGVPVLSILSIWHLLAMVVGFNAITPVRMGTAFGYVAFGWIALQLLQNTVGQPIANLGRRLSNMVAGVDLATSRREIREAMQAQMNDASLTWQTQLRERITEIRQASMVEGSIGDKPSNVERTPESIPESIPERPPAESSPTLPVEGRVQPVDGRNESGRQGSRIAKTAVGLIGMVTLTVFVVVLFRPIQVWLSDWSDHIPQLVRPIFDLAWIAMLATVVAGLIAPLETLGWWAGWYDDEVDTTINSGELAQTPARIDGEPQTVSRYIVYLDGIGKSTFEYLPDIEEFLETLAPQLPNDVALIRGIMPYSVMNNPLDEDRPLAFLWKVADTARFANPRALLGILINIRNVLIVGVSADKRYGPLYNQGIAQVVYNGLVKNGYPLGSVTPITLIGYSGGGQMACACAPFLKRALSAPIDIISLGGVLSANCNILQLEHLYHLVGDRDRVEQIGPIMFPGRWKLFLLSYWNRAKRRGNISIVSMGPIGHQVPGGILDPNCVLPNGRRSLEQTIDYINAILKGKLLPELDLSAVKPSNYDLYRQVPFTRPSYYPLKQPVDLEHYRAIAPWMGRLILPRADERPYLKGVWFEVHHAPDTYQDLVGRVVRLGWTSDPITQRLVKAVTKDVHFSAEAEYTSKYGGLVHPTRLNHWLKVDPLESLAGSHPVDDLIVALDEPVTVEPWTQAPEMSPSSPDSSVSLSICSTPVQVTGRFYGLVQFIQPVGDDHYQVIHFNRASRQFDGPHAVVAMPWVIADQTGCFPSTNRNIEKSPLNEIGWYIYGATDAVGQFVVQALAPRGLLRLQPDRVVFGEKAAYRYIRNDAWADIRDKKRRISSVLCTCRDQDTPVSIHHALDEWQAGVGDEFPEGTRALVLHVYGGIGGEKREPAAASPIFFGHFAYGVATVIRDPLADELRFDIRYHQVYTHNTDGLVAGTLHWSRYLGDRQFGWVGVRPVCDIVVKLDAFTGNYDMNGVRRSPFNAMLGQLQAMTARYRIGDGTGGTYVGPANNCSQDSNQALFASIQQIQDRVQSNADWLKGWEMHYPDQAARFEYLLQLGHDLEADLQPLGKPRPDWEKNEYNLGSTLEDEPVRNVIMGLSSWRTLLPRKASDTVVKRFLQYGASVWVLRTNQIGGFDPDVEPIAPMTL